MLNMYKIKILMLLMVISISGIAQNKVNFSLAQKINEVSSDYINVFVQGNIEVIQSITKQNNGNFKYSSGDIAVIEIQPKYLAHFIENKNIKRIEAYPQHIQVLNDTLLINNNVNPVHNGQSPLTQSYDGTGIVIGFIDTGIDFTHPDFKDSTGKTRIKYIWDQTKSTGGTTPLPYNYGQEWNNTQIDAGQASVHNDIAFAGHGTHVTSIGSGNGLSTGTYKGVAPNSDIIMVAIDFNSPSATLITDAVNYIYSKAQQLGKPCVINGSLGDPFGSHDGKDLQAQLIKNMITQQTGRAFVAAAGNDGQKNTHLGYTVTSDTNFTFFNYPSSNGLYIQLWADTNDLKNVKYTVGADKLSPYSCRGNISFRGINSCLGFIKHDTLYNSNNQRIGVLQSFGDLIGSTYSLDIYIKADSTNYKWRFATTGSGKFDLWTYDTIPSSAIPSSAVMPDSIFYKYPDKNKTIVSSFQCLDEVITVGNYSNRKKYIDCNNNIYTNPTNIAGNLHPSSSRGPTRDGRIKPDITSPGDMTLAAVVLSLVPSIKSNYPSALAKGEHHVRSGGTSHSSPGVAGVAALYLQKNPFATAMDVRNAIMTCSRYDSFTGTNLPNNNWGYGKVDAYKTLTLCSILGVEETQKNDSFIAYPNPSNNNQVTLKFNTENKISQIKISNVLGETVKVIQLNTNQSEIQLQLNSGIYFIDGFINTTKATTQKIIIL